MQNTFNIYHTMRHDNLLSIIPNIRITNKIQSIGMIDNDNFIKHIEAHSVKNPDVTGAGDTVIAALSIAYAKTQDIALSAHFANNAAATVVGKPGTATASLQEIEKLSL